MKITLLVSGSIAAYKAAELVRALKKRGAEVQVAMSSGAKEFITPLTLQTLSGNRVLSDLFDLESEAEIGHIALADRADLVIVAPATANVIAKAALGLADDIIGTTLLATKARVLIAPAMNVNMWNNPLTQERVRKLKSLSWDFVGPSCGELACGWQGEGRLAEIEDIVSAAFSSASRELEDVHVIVSAGPTREPIDPIRFVSNRSSGKMGYALAEAAQKKGARVSLVSGPVSLPAPSGVNCVFVNTALQMRESLKELISSSKAGRCILYMAAAISDHSPSFVADKKLKDFKNREFSLSLSPSPDILAEIAAERRELHPNLSLIGFAAETAENEAELMELALLKLKNKGVDFVVANAASDSFEQDTNRVLLVGSNLQPRFLDKAAKSLVAEQILSLTTAGDVD